MSNSNQQASSLRLSSQPAAHPTIVSDSVQEDLGTTGSVHETPLTCVDCGAAASSKSRFCGRCGSLLWEPCLGCGEENSVSEAFCSACGAGLAEILRATEESIQAEIAKAAEDFNKGFVSWAIERLEKIQVSEHSRLLAFEPQIESIRSQYKKLSERARNESQAVAATARELLETFDFQQAIAAIERIPLGLRNDELNKLFEDASALLKEKRDLCAIVKRQIDSKQFDGLLSRAERLLALEPDNEQYSKLVKQLQVRQQKIHNSQAKLQLAAALRSLQKNEYASAAAALERVPAEVPDRQDLNKLQMAQERVWLARYVSTAPLADAITAHLAGRLAKLQPTDERLLKTVSSLQTRWKKSQNTGATAAWARVPVPTYVGRAVELFTPPAPLAQAALGKKWSPEQLIVAYQLAREAIGETRLTLDLAPKASNSWTANLKLGKRGRRPTTCWGIDIGRHRIKAIRLAPTEAPTDAPIVQEVIVQPYNKDAQYEENVESLLAKVDLKGSSLVINFPTNKTLSRFFRLPILEVKRDQLDQVVRFEAKSRIHLAAEESVLDYIATDINQGDGSSKVKQRQVAVLAAKKEDAALRLAPFAKCGAQSVKMSTDAVAMLNVDVHSSAQPQTITAQVEIGYEATNVAIATDGGNWLRSFYGGVKDFEQAIAKSLQINRLTAAKMLGSIEKVPLVHKLDEALLPAFKEYADQLTRVLEQLEGECDQPFEQLKLSGGGARSFGLLRFLRTGK